MRDFLCDCCGQTHAGLPTDKGWTLPDVVWAIPQEDRQTRAKFDSDRCQLGERFFIRCILEIPFTEQAGYYGWGVWVELAEVDFWRYIELYDKDGSREPQVSGAIANAIPAYPSTLELPVTVQFQSSTSRPTVHLLADSQHPLALEQCDGIDSRRYHEILEA
ncbi:MAG: DUF2199 domain-containing protein [Pseudoxanthomonas sp.]|jgi:hypothetical protein